MRLGASFMRTTVRRLHTSSGGNPFFALELARALLRGSKLPLAGEPLPVPETLRDLVWERLAGLPEEVRSALLVVAAGSQLTIGMLEEVIGSRERTAAQLGTAVEAGVLEVDRGRLRFSHPLLREVLYGEAGRDERQRVHRRLARVVRDPEEQARHLGLATELTGRGGRGGAGGGESASRCARCAGCGGRVCRTGVPADAGRAGSGTHCGVQSPRVTTCGTRARQVVRGGSLTSSPRRSRPERTGRGCYGGLRAPRLTSRGFEPVVPLLERARVEAGGNAALRAAVERDLGLALTQLGSCAGPSRTRARG